MRFYEKLCESVTDVGGILLVLTAFTGVAYCSAGCPDPKVTPVERSYEAAIIACASATGLPAKYDRATDLRCRAAVDCAYHVGPCEVSK